MYDAAKAHNRIFSSVARNLRNGRLAGEIKTMDDFVAVLSEQLVQLPRDSDDRWPDAHADLRHQLIRGGQYRGRSADFIKHILWYLDKGAMNGEPHGSLAVEHIFPQTPDDQWRASLTDNDYRLMEQRADGLPNLALLEANEPPLQNEAGNKPFPDKRTTYAKSGVQMTKDLCTYTSWGPTQIEMRADELVRLICRLWPRPEGKNQGESAS